ncbi:unnamed protein product [Acanthoscelides obtectus]|uniref:CCHC-type domain-containing protein n=1 Tax=Acanthoscelides obtectus TaxID=200917 RepID=A0A9P0PNG7_ACAOB|nr:unnamed protein product [Acanthoscelides obtectus]CAK1638659.1 hypothetical protein AOBTE_LOCUS10739 [Acanthoscelides obtectus]
MADDVDVCAICADNFIVNSKVIKCKLCVKSFHPVCVGLKDLICKYLCEFDNLIWFCDNCKQVGNSSVTKSQLDVNSDSNSHMLILQKEIECLNREKDIQAKLISELESSLELHKFKSDTLQKELSEAKSAIAPVKNIAQVLQKNVKNEKNVESSVLLVKSADRNNRDDVLQVLSKTIIPSRLNICISGTKKIKEGVAVYCKGDDDVAKLKNAVNGQINGRLTANELKKYNPRLLVKNVNFSDDIKDDKMLIENIVGLNDMDDHADLKVITKIERTRQIVLEVSPDLRKKLLTRGYVWLGWRKCPIVDHLRITQCFRCCKFGHIAKQCKSSTSACIKCSRDHMANQCEVASDQVKCIICVSYGSKSKSHVQVNHAANDSHCPAYINYVRNLKNRINFD